MPALRPNGELDIRSTYKPHEKANRGFSFLDDLKIAKEKIKKVTGMLK
jgi:hypothetical protein|tara:strand:- start:390 stop:533 length:144 start_codon:yes stop_codon:yes gene_type:complete